MSYQDVFEEWEALAPLDELVQPLVRHLGQRLDHPVVGGRVRAVAGDVTICDVTRVTREPEMLHVHDFLLVRVERVAL